MEMWVGGGLLQGWGHWNLLKEITVTFITSTIVWPQVKQKGGKAVPPPKGRETGRTQFPPPSVSPIKKLP